MGWGCLTSGMVDPQCRRTLNFKTGSGKNLMRLSKEESTIVIHPVTPEPSPDSFCTRVRITPCAVTGWEQIGRPTILLPKTGDGDAGVNMSWQPLVLQIRQTAGWAVCGEARAERRRKSLSLCSMLGRLRLKHCI